MTDASFDSCVPKNVTKIVLIYENLRNLMSGKVPN